MRTKIHSSTTIIGASIACLLGPLAAIAQHPPGIGYMFPPGGHVGQTIEVSLGGYDWTPDMQVIVHDNRIQLEIIGDPGPIIVPEPPYWFGKKARRAPFALPRETRARLTIPAKVAPGVFKWQAANANGATACGRFRVTNVPMTTDTSGAEELLDSLPACVSGQIKHIREVDRFHFVAAESGPVTCSMVTASINSPLRAILEIRNAKGKLVADVADTAGYDTKLTFAASAGEVYTAEVYDLDFRGDRSFVYQLEIVPGAQVEQASDPVKPDFQIQTAEFLNLPIGGKGTLVLNVTRSDGFVDPLDVTLARLPVGVTVGVTGSESLQVPANQNTLSIEFQVDAAAAATAAMVTIQGQATIHEQVQHRAEPLLFATTIKPPFVIDAEGQDDVTKWPRGTTFPAPVLIVRDAGFTADLRLEMTSLQGRHVQGIAGPDLWVRPEQTRVLYPVYLPEWLETTRTSRMEVNGVAQVADPQGNLRYSVSKQTKRMGFLPTGALLKISIAQPELIWQPGSPLTIPVLVDRDKSLSEPLTLTLVLGESELSPCSAAPQSFDHDVAPCEFEKCEFAIDVNAAAWTGTEYPLTIRATLLKDGQYPVISETTVIVSTACTACQ